MPKFFAKVKKKWSPYLSDIPQVPLAQHRFFHFIPSPRGTPDVAVEFQFVALSLRNGVPPLPSRGRKRHTVYDARHFRGEHETVLSRKLCAANLDVNEADDSCSATYDFCMKAYNRNSMKDKGMRINKASDST